MILLLNISILWCSSLVNFSSMVVVRICSSSLPGLKSTSAQEVSGLIIAHIHWKVTHRVCLILKIIRNTLVLFKEWHQDFSNFQYYYTRELYIILCNKQCIYIYNVNDTLFNLICGRKRSWIMKVTLPMRWRVVHFA